MGASELLKLLFTHPNELRVLLSYKFSHNPVNDIQSNPAASGWDREQMRACWRFLDLTSRSFAAVIKELKGELSRAICIYYLILRGLDTIEDDMTIANEAKIPLLTAFHEKLYQPGWTFTESGPNEKDRQLLVEFDKVIGEFGLLDEKYQTVIADMTAKMGGGMASYIELSGTKGTLKVEKWADYDLYCHFVAGLVGEGLSRLFSASGLESPIVGQQLRLANHMGLYLQKTNIIRDYAEDCEEGRYFWPAEAWSRSGCDFKSQAEVASGVEEYAPGKFRPVEGELGKRSMAVLSTMLLDAMRHVTSVLDYLKLLHEQSVFNFAAIPQVMAIATLDLLFGNPAVFKRNLKIRKGEAVLLIISATNPRDVAYIFRDYARKIHARLSPDDLNYIEWCIELSRIEVWCEAHYPTYVSVPTHVVGPERIGAGGAPPGTWNRRKAIEEVRENRRVTALASALDPSLRKDGVAQASLEILSQEEQRAAREKRESRELFTFMFIYMVILFFFVMLLALVAWEVTVRHFLSLALRSYLLTVLHCAVVCVHGRAGPNLGLDSRGLLLGQGQGGRRSRICCCSRAEARGHHSGQGGPVIVRQLQSVIRCGQLVTRIEVTEARVFAVAHHVRAL